MRDRKKGRGCYGERWEAERRREKREGAGRRWWEAEKREGDDEGERKGGLWEDERGREGGGVCWMLV